MPEITKQDKIKNKLLGRIDRFIALYEESRQEMAVMANQISRLEARVLELERQRA